VDLRNLSCAIVGGSAECATGVREQTKNSYNSEAPIQNGVQEIVG